MKNEWLNRAILGLAFVMLLSVFILAQNQPSRAPAQVLTQTPEQVQKALAQGRQSKLENIRKQLAATDEEWIVLGPMIEKILALSSDANAGLSAIARQIAPTDAKGSAVLQELTGKSVMANKMQGLQEAIDNPAIPESVLRTRLSSVRAERVKIRGELATLRAELAELLTQRQEAILFTLQVIE